MQRNLADFQHRLIYLHALCLNRKEDPTIRRTHRRRPLHCSVPRIWTPWRHSSGHLAGGRVCRVAWICCVQGREGANRVDRMFGSHSNGSCMWHICVSNARDALPMCYSWCLGPFQELHLQGTLVPHCGDFFCWQLGILYIWIISSLIFFFLLFCSMWYLKTSIILIILSNTLSYHTPLQAE